MEIVESDPAHAMRAPKIKREGDTFYIWRDGKCRVAMSPAVLQAYSTEMLRALRDWHNEQAACAAPVRLRRRATG